jgi:TPR repeat protein
VQLGFLCGVYLHVLHAITYGVVSAIIMWLFSACGPRFHAIDDQAAPDAELMAALGDLRFLALSADCARAPTERCIARGRALLSVDPTRAAAEFAEACVRGSFTGCRELALIVDDAMDRGDLAQDLMRWTCERDDNASCWLLMERWPFPLLFRPSVDSRPSEAAFRSFRLVSAHCQRGSARACVMLGDAWQAGWTAPSNSTRAFRAYDRACALRLGLGCRRLAERLEFEGADDDDEDSELVRRYWQACELRDSVACMWLANAYEEGFAWDRDAASALRWRACRQGLGSACLLSALRQRCDAAPPVCEQHYLQWLTRACDLGEAEGCARVARSLAGRDEEQARTARFAERACQGYNREGCLLLGQMYQQGRGVTANAERAMDFFERACYGSSNIDERGLCGNGAEDNLSERPGCADYIALAASACDAGNVERCMSLADFELEEVPPLGSYRLEPRSQSASLYTSACDRGHPVACFRLLQLGQSDDTHRTLVLAERACSRHDPRACALVLHLRALGEPDAALATTLLGLACEGGQSAACTQLIERTQYVTNTRDANATMWRYRALARSTERRKAEHSRADSVAVPERPIAMCTSVDHQLDVVATLHDLYHWCHRHGFRVQEETKSLLRSLLQ